MTEADKNTTTNQENQPLLDVRDLQVDFTADGRTVHAVRNASFNVYPGQWVAIVGESGSGKSTSAMAVLGLLPGTGKVTGGSIRLNGRELVGLDRKDYEALRGSQVGLVPQDPMSNLNPVWRIGSQVKEALTANHMDVSREKRSRLAKALAGDEEVKVKRSDDELFISSKDLSGLLEAARQALSDAGVADVDKTMEAMKAEWDVGSETRWGVAKSLIDAGVDDDTAWTVAKEHVTGSDMDDRIAGLLSEAGLPEAATRARQYPTQGSRAGGLGPQGLRGTTRLPGRPGPAGPHEQSEPGLAHRFPSQGGADRQPHGCLPGEALPAGQGSG